MKNTLIRTFAILMLATSMSAFGANTNPCSGKEAGKSSTTQDQTTNKNAKKEKKANQKAKDQNDKSDQEKEFDRVLQGMWG